MRIDEFLNARGIEVLQALQEIWCPGRDFLGSKSALLRSLREAMLDHRAASRVCSELDALPRRCLHVVLRSPGFETDLGRIAAELPDRLTPHLVQKAVSVLCDQGLVYLDSTERFPLSVHRVITVPVELGELLLGILQIERRSPLEMLSLGEQLRQRGVRTEAICESIRSAPERLASLSPKSFGDAVRRAIAEFGGMVRLDDLPGLGLSSGDTAVAGYRRHLEESQLGTAGGLSLWSLGINYNETSLIVYQEVVDAVQAAATVPAPAEASVSSLAPDLLSDLVLLAECADDFRIRLTQEGDMHKAAARRAGGSFALRKTGFHEEDDLLALEFRLAGLLKLVVPREDGVLHCGPQLELWRTRPLPQQLAEIANLLQDARSAEPANALVLRCLGIAVELVRELEPGRWYAAASLVDRIFARLLLRADTLTPRRVLGGGSEESFLTPKALKHAILHTALADLYAVGAVDLDTHRRPAFRLSGLGARAFGRTAAPQPRPGKVLIINPDFEIVLLPEGDVAELIYQLGRFCEREKTDQTYHLKLTRTSVERAAAAGLRAREMLDLLATYSRAPIPQNVAYSVESWAGGVRLAALSHVCLLETADPETMDIVSRLPTVRELVVRRLSPTATVLSAIPSDEKTLATLRRLRVYLRDTLPGEKEAL